MDAVTLLSLLVAVGFPLAVAGFYTWSGRMEPEPQVTEIR